MTNETVQPLNYSAHALGDLRRVQENMRETMPGSNSAAVLGKVMSMLERSVKFLLPNCCELIAPEELRQDHVDIARLPFPCVAFEAPWKTDDFKATTVAGQEMKEVTKRIALCWEPQSGIEPVPGLSQWILNGYPEGGVCVLSICWGPELPHWTVNFGGVFTPYETEVTTLRETIETNAARLAHEALRDRNGAPSQAKTMMTVPFPIFEDLRDFAESKLGGRDEVDAVIMSDTHDERAIQLQVCAVLGCANVEVGDVEPSTKLNKKREAKGHQPFFSYKVLELSEERAAVGKSQHGGTHASPRMHLRRGHIRRLPGDRGSCWVRPSMVNAKSPRGVVKKDYRIVEKA